VGLWDRLAEAVLLFIDSYDDLAISVLVLLEEAGLPLPLPGDILIILAGIRIAQGEMQLVRTWITLELVTILGSTILYWLSRRGGRPLVYRFGRYLHLTPARLARMEERINRGRGVAIFVGRLIPGLRIVTPVAAGVFGVPFRHFLPALASSGAVSISVYLALGMIAGPQAIDTLHGLRFSLRAVLSIALFVGLGTFLFRTYRLATAQGAFRYRRRRSRGSVETVLLAGLLATVEMGLGVNSVLYAFGVLGFEGPEDGLVRLIEVGAARFMNGNEPLFAIMLALILSAGGLLWALLYAGLPTDRLPGSPWMQGVLFSTLPLAASVLAVLPLLGAGPLGLQLGAGLLPLLGEVFRNGLYGAGLGASYALLREARGELRSRSATAQA
jgi:membrane-associated protein